MNVIKMMLLAVVAMVTVSSCDDDDTYYYPAVPRLNALVTVKHTSEGKFYLQLDDKTAVWPVNMSVSPFGDKEVRALASIDFVDDLCIHMTVTTEDSETGSFSGSSNMIS